MSDPPDGWVATTLGELGNYWNGRGFKRSEWRPAGHGRPIIRIQDLTGSNHNPNYFDGDVDDRNVARFGDVLVSWAATLGVFEWRGPEAVINQHIFKVESFIDQGFHRYLIESVLDDLRRRSHGTGMVHVTRRVFDETPVLIPPPAEQHRIVAMIEEALSNLEDGVANLRAARSRLTVLRRLIIESASSGQLPLGGSVVQDAKPRRWGAQYSSTKPDPFAGQELPPVPPGWSWVRAASACEAVESGGTPSAELMTADKGDIPFIKVYNLTTTGFLDFSVKPTFIGVETHRGQFRSVARPGDVLTNIVGPPLGKVAIVPDSFPEWNMNQAVVVFRPGEGLEGRFLALALQSRFVMDRLERTSKATVGQFNVSLTACRYLPLPIPALAVQRAVVDEFERRISEIDASGGSIDAQLARAATLRRSILAYAFRGRLVPQDLSGEPTIRKGRQPA